MNINKLKKWLMIAFAVGSASCMVLFCVVASWAIMYEGTSILMQLAMEQHIKLTFSLALALFLLWLQILVIDSALWAQKCGIDKANRYGEGL